MLLVTFNSLVASDAEQVRSKVVLCLWQEARKEQNQFLLFFFLANERACLLKKTRVFYLKLTMWHVLPLLCTSNKRIRTGYKCKARRQHLLVLLCLLVLCYLRLEGRKKHASSLHKGAIVCILTVRRVTGRNTRNCFASQGLKNKNTKQLGCGCGCGKATTTTTTTTIRFLRHFPYCFAKFSSVLFKNLLAFHINPFVLCQHNGANHSN